MKKSRIEVVKDEEKKTKSKEVITIDIRSKHGDVDEHHQNESVVCLTIDKSKKAMKCIIAGSFSPGELMAYLNGIDTVKKELLKKVAGMLSEGLDDIIRDMEEEEE